MNIYLQSLLGGLLIGLSVTLMLWLNGRVTGISGILGGLLQFKKNDTFWRLSFILGLLIGGIFLKIFIPESLQSTLTTPNLQLVAAGLLVGFGTLLGNGCTSGHGVCGISRLSPRSLIATILFMSAGILITYLAKMGLAS